MLENYYKRYSQKFKTAHRGATRGNRVHISPQSVFGSGLASSTTEWLHKVGSGSKRCSLGVIAGAWRPAEVVRATSDRAYRLGAEHREIYYERSTDVPAVPEDASRDSIRVWMGTCWRRRASSAGSHLRHGRALPEAAVVQLWRVHGTRV